MSTHRGSSLASFLDEEGIKPEVDLRAKKKILADQMRTKMEREAVTVAELARRMNTSRTVVGRLLAPSDTSFTFRTLAKASRALGLDLSVSLSEKRAKRPRTTRRTRAGV